MKSLSAADRVLRSDSLLSFCEAALFIFRSGKLLELTYFGILEAYFWWCHAFGIKSRLISFTPRHFFCWHPDQGPVDVQKLAAIVAGSGFSAARTSINWEAFADTPTGTIFGTTCERPHVLQRSDGLFLTPTDVAEFDVPIVSVFISSRGGLFVSTKGTVYRSGNDGKDFDAVLHLSHAESCVWQDHGIEETAEGLVIGEYASIVNLDRTHSRSFWKSVAYLYSSQDDGKSWRRADYLANNGIKHVHLVKYSHRLSRLLITDGDKHKRAYWVSSIDDLKVKFNRFDSFFWGGGHTGYSEIPDGTFLGTDYPGGTNSIVRLRSVRNGQAKMLPSPYRRSPIMHMCSLVHGERSFIFALLHSGLQDKWKSAVIYSDDGGDNWHRLLEYNGRYGTVSVATLQRGTVSSLIVTFQTSSPCERTTVIISPNGRVRLPGERLTFRSVI